jgi:hypothetical protein
MTVSFLELFYGGGVCGLWPDHDAIPLDRIMI